LVLYTGELPGAVRRGRLVPDAVFNQIIPPVGLQHGGAGVGRVAHVGAVDGGERGLAVVLDLDLSRPARNCLGFGDLRVEHRVFRFGRAGDEYA
jgi:hypothetical protein